MKTPRLQEKYLNQKCDITLSQEIASDIYYMHAACGKTEWSGVLFYEILSGDVFNGDDLDIKLLKFFPLDIGTPGYTEFEFGTNLMDIFDKYPDLMTKKYGLIHTHHTMSTFFSGTDQDTLHEQAPLFDYFLSVIVNLEGDVKGRLCYVTEEEVVGTSSVKYPLGITIQREHKETVKILNIIECSPFFETNLGDSVKELKRKNKEKQEVKNFWSGRGNNNAFDQLPLFSNQDSLQRTHDDWVDGWTHIDRTTSNSVLEFNRKNLEETIACTLVDSFLGEVTLEKAKKEFNSLHKDEKEDFVLFFGDSLDEMLVTYFKPNLGDMLTDKEKQLLKLVVNEVLLDLKISPSQYQKCSEDLNILLDGFNGQF